MRKYNECARWRLPCHIIRSAHFYFQVARVVQLFVIFSGYLFYPQSAGACGATVYRRLLDMRIDSSTSRLVTGVHSITREIHSTGHSPRRRLEDLNIAELADAWHPV